MQQIVRGFGLVALLACSSPLLAEDLTVSALKAFTAKIDDATARCDVDAVVGHVAELAMLTLNKNENGGMRILRMNKSKYRQFLTLMCSGTLDYRYARTNEKISIDGDQAIITADVTETWVDQGREITAKSREKATVESIDGKLMLTQLVSTQTL
jgi:hypothetical protein